MRSKKTPLMRAVCFHFLKKTEHGLNMYKKKKEEEIHLHKNSFLLHSWNRIFVCN